MSTSRSKFDELYKKICEQKRYSLQLPCYTFLSQSKDLSGICGPFSPVAGGPKTFRSTGRLSTI